MDGLSAAASVIAVIQITEKVCSKLQKYIWAVKDAKKDIERLKDEVLVLHGVLEKVYDLKMILAQSVAFDVDQGITELKTQSAATRKDIAATRKDVANIRADMKTHQVNECHDKIIQWLSVVDPSSNHHNACEKRQAKTGEWLINHSAFKGWKTKQNSLLWLYGKRVVEPELEFFDPEDRLRDPPNDILEISGGLVTLPTNDSSTDGSDIDSESFEYQSSHVMNRDSDDLPSRKLRLAHFSVKEYLVSQRIRDSEASIFALSDVPANQFLTTICPLYIYHYDESTLKTTSIKDLERFPLLMYSCKFWYIHAQSIPLENQEQIDPLMSRLFFSVSPLLSWLRIHQPNKIEFKSFGPLSQIKSPLYYASFIGLSTIVHSLIADGSDVDSKENDSLTALHTAAQKGHRAVVQVLLDQGANVNASNIGGKTPLYYAVKNNHEPVVLLLLNHNLNAATENTFDHKSVTPAGNKAEIDAVTTKGETVLHLAAWFGNATIVRWLLDHKANINAENKYGETALHHAAWNESEFVVRLLLDRKANIDVKDKNGETALHNAAWNESEVVAQVLLDRKANINAENKDGETALHTAAWKRSESIVQLLLDHNANINAENKNGEKALHCAACEGSKSVAQVLLDRKANINAEDKFGMTALHHAAQEKSELIVQLLLDRKAEIDKKDIYGRTASDVAVEEGNDDIDC